MLLDAPKFEDLPELSLETLKALSKGLQEQMKQGVPPNVPMGIEIAALFKIVETLVRRMEAEQAAATPPDASETPELDTSFLSGKAPVEIK